MGPNIGIIAGGAFSNHIAATAAAGKVFGIKINTCGIARIKITFS